MGRRYPPVTARSACGPDCRNGACDAGRRGRRELMARPSWVPGRTIYQLHSLGAAGVPAANPDAEAPEPSGRGMAVLEGWLDHIAWLGCGGVLLTPVVVSSTHGYDTVDPFRIDQRLGDE